MAGIRRLNHAVLYVTDAKKSATFYCDVLGFSVVQNTAGGRAVFIRALNLINRQVKRQKNTKALPITRIVQINGNNFFAWCSCQWQEEHTSKSSAHRSKRAHLQTAHFHCEFQFDKTKKGKS